MLIESLIFLEFLILIFKIESNAPAKDDSLVSSEEAEDRIIIFIPKFIFYICLDYIFSLKPFISGKNIRLWYSKMNDFR